MTRTLAIGLLLLLTSSAWADAPRLTLPEAIRTALQRHPSLVRRAEDRAAAVAREQRAASEERPHFGIEALGKDGPAGAPNFSFPGLANAGITRHVGADVVLSQQFDFGRTLHRTRARHAAAEASRADERTQAAQVVLGVYRAFDDALLAGALARVARKNEETRGTTMRQAEARNRAGLTSRVDVGLARAAEAEARAARIRAESARWSAMAALNAAMGIDGPPDYDLVEADPAGGAIPTLAEAVARGLRDRPETDRQRAQIRAAEEALRAASAGSAPVVRLLLSGGWLNVAPRNTDPNTYAVGIGMTVPLYTGGAVEADVGESRHQLGAVRAADAELAQEIRLQVTRAWWTLRALLDSQEAVAAEVREARDSEWLATLRYRHRLGSIVELQQAQLAVLGAEINEARLRFDIATARAALRYAMGAAQEGDRKP